MTDSEIIAKLTREIEELKQENKMYKEMEDSIYNMIYGIGGPLNDNYYQFTNKQLKPFRKITKYFINY